MGGQRDLGLKKIEGRQYRLDENLALPEKILTGGWPVQQPMVFATRKFYRQGRPAWREDALIFPEKGAHLLIFAVREGKDWCAVVNGVNGLLPFDARGRSSRMIPGLTLPEAAAKIKELLAMP